MNFRAPKCPIAKVPFLVPLNIIVVIVTIILGTNLIIKTS